MKNFHFKTICNITYEPQELQRFYCACEFIGKSAVIKYDQLLSKVINMNSKSHFYIGPYPSLCACDLVQANGIFYSQYVAFIVDSLKPVPDEMLTSFHSLFETRRKCRSYKILVSLMTFSHVLACI